MGYAHSGSQNRGNDIMVRVNKEEIKGITGERHKSSCAAKGDNAAKKEGDKGGAFHCDGDECQLEWTDD